MAIVLAKDGGMAGAASSMNRSSGAAKGRAAEGTEGKAASSEVTAAINQDTMVETPPEPVNLAAGEPAAPRFEAAERIGLNRAEQDQIQAKVRQDIRNGVPPKQVEKNAIDGVLAAADPLTNKHRTEQNNERASIGRTLAEVENLKIQSELSEKGGVPAIQQRYAAGELTLEEAGAQIGTARAAAARAEGYPEIFTGPFGTVSKQELAFLKLAKDVGLIPNPA